MEGQTHYLPLANVSMYLPPGQVCMPIIIAFHTAQSKE